jgi:hypothetical protein
MILVCTATADTYITNKIINGSFLATDANVGRAGTLDLFKLYDENSLNNVTGQIELSRALLKFDLQPIYDLTGSKIDINNSSFKAILQLYDISSGNSTPSNFNLNVFPLGTSFDEGVGRDISSFNDLDRANWITASYSSNSGNSTWVSGGCGYGNILGQTADYYSSGNLGSGISVFDYKQNFLKGSEDLAIDVTQLVSATIAGIIPNNGFRLSFSGSEETDTKTRFVKRFASRHSSNPLLKPKILVRYDDSIRDDSGDFRFDTSGSLFLQSFNGSLAANIVSGSSLTPVTGTNCFILQINNKNYNFYVTGSQLTAGTQKDNVKGVYYASFAIPSSDSSIVTGSVTLSSMIAASGSVDFTTFWNSLDGTVCYHTGSLKISRVNRNSADFTQRRPAINLTNLLPEHKSSDVVRLRAFGVDIIKQIRAPAKRALDLTSEIYENVYYQVYDSISKNVIIPYDNVNNSTLLSTDSKGMFFDFKMQSLAPGRSYGFEFYIVDMGSTFMYRDPDSNFTVRP